MLPTIAFFALWVLIVGVSTKLGLDMAYVLASVETMSMSSDFLLTVHVVS